MKNLNLFVICLLSLTGCGKQGSVGAQGLTGITGADGTSGNGCNVSTLAVGSPGAPNGGSLITCPNNTSSVVLNGASGNNGSDGMPGTVITPVQFCTGFTQSYPSTFAESGLCVAGTLYGVYSENGGFLAELPPGQYSSDGINSSCTFTIGNNCSVTED